MSKETKEKKHWYEHFLPTWASHRVAEHRKAGWQRFYESIRTKNNVVHVNDCQDDDARTRLTARSSEILGQPAGFVGVHNDLEGAGGIITALDSLNGASHPTSRRHRNVILANWAPRNGDGAQYENGSPFCYFWYQGTLVVTTLQGRMLSLVKKFGLVDEVHVLDTRETLNALWQDGMISSAEEARIGDTQFRSLEFSPRIAAYLLRHKRMKGAQKLSLEEVPDAGGVVWHVDRFAEYANCKTTLTLKDVTINTADTSQGPYGSIATKRFGTVPFFPSLALAPEGVPSIVVGSSGLGEDRFLEVVINGGSAGKHFDVSVGDEVL
jgi:hypothetical protein